MMLMNIGKSFVALTAVAEETSHPVKKKDSPAVVGIPRRKPPNLPPLFVVTKAMTITQVPITPKVNTRRTMVMSSDGDN